MKNPQTFTQDELPATYLPADVTDTHPRPSAVEALERSKMRHAASDHTQRVFWVWFFIGLAVLLTLGIVLGLRQT